ncbi:hypothetical protein C8F01DRAFT_1170578 [Mycena amicta]|nr:hypothetical protein C8F01DRAFT_1170578 [Mycena amicta]
MQDPDPLPADYDPSFEWPETEELIHAGPSHPLLRLVVLRTSVLPPKQTHVVADEFTELQFGRDASHSNDVPRVRLPEIQVSRLHATAYWNSDDEGWHIVDMGSVHGTFHQSAAQLTAAVRLSPARVASPPRRLRHLDALAIGSTTFLIHIHEGEPCEECSSCSTPQNEIPLFQTPKRRAATPSGYLPSGRDSKKALLTLKQRLLSSSDAGPSRRTPPADYIDRSARRRAVYPSSRHDAPGAVRAEPILRRAEPPKRVELVSQSPSANSWEPPPLMTQSQPPTPLPTSNIGHKLLLAQGWRPGTTLGVDDGTDDDGRIRLKAPIEVASRNSRAGLGTVA